MIKIISGKCEGCVGVAAANVIEEAVKSNPRAVLGLATGSSPLSTYRELIARYKAGKLSFADVKSVNLDEYVGLAPNHDQSYAYFMNTNLFSHIDIKPENTNIPSGLASDALAECARYDAVIESLGGVDVQVLGIGNNGHIGFNEPSDRFTKGTNLVKLTDSTIDANARFFATRDLVPTAALTMGIGQIIKAKRILLIALGKGKAEILERALFGEVTPEVPASILQFARDVVVCADEAALSVIAERHPEALKA